MKSLIKNYIGLLTKEKVKEFSLNNNINLTNQEIEYLLNLVKTKYDDILKNDTKYLDELKSKWGDNYNKYIVDDMKKVLFKLVKNKNNRAHYSKGVLQQVGFEKYEDVDVKMWKEILSETFYETLFNSASDKRKELLNIHRRSRKEIFELSKFLYPESYTLGKRILYDDLLIPSYDVLTRIVVNKPENSINTINHIINKWQIQHDKIDKKMTMGVITFYNNYSIIFKLSLLLYLKTNHNLKIIHIS